MPPVAASNGLPSSSRLRVDVLAPLGRELVGALALDLDGVDQALVLELLERGVDRAGARLPDALGAALDLLDQLVAVLRLLFEQEQERGADVAAPGAGTASSAAAAMVAGAAEAGTEHRLELARVPEGSAAPGHEGDQVLPTAGTAVVVVLLAVVAWTAPLAGC